MAPATSCWSLLLALVMANLFHQRFAQQVEFLALNNRVLKRQIAEGQKRPRPTPREKRRLAELAKDLGRACLLGLKDSLIVTPCTFMRWYRDLCVAKYNSAKTRRRPGRPRTSDETRQLVIRLAKENMRAGYTRICDVMRALKYAISRTTVANILREEGIPIAPNRGMGWHEFLRLVWETLAAVDMFTVDTPTSCYYVLFAIRAKTRQITIAGITENPTARWMANMTRHLTDGFDGALRDCTHIIHDRDPSFIWGMDHILTSSGIDPVITSVRSPNLNAYAERWVRSIRQDCLDHVPIFCEAQLRYVLAQYVAWYNHERPHQGLDGQYIDRLDEVGDGDVISFSRLTGLLRHYTRASA